MKVSVRRLAYLIIAGLVLISLYLTVIPLYVDRVAKSGAAPVDPRVYARENKIKRGAILDRQGVVLARSVPGEKGNWIREYPLGSAFAHVVGYYGPGYGSAGLEKSLAPTLQGLEHGNQLGNLRDLILGRSREGNEITLTIDADLQQYAAALMKGKTGAAVALNPVTGEILALVSYPDYDPLRVEDFMQQSGSPMLNRATQGAYPPGSVFKIVTAAGVLNHLPELAREPVDCTGKLEVGGFVLQDFAVHGRVDLHGAMAKSCNVAFGGYGVALGQDKLVGMAQGFGVGVKLDFPLPLYQGNVTSGTMDGPALASTAIGQGKLLVSPLQAALFAAAVANDGVIMKPYLVAGSKTPGGVTRVQRPQAWLRAMDPEVAAVLKEDMALVVRQGTGTAAALPGVQVAGKTGSAENPHGAPHAWFVAFAPVQSPRVAVAVLVENAGSGGANAAPIAREMMRRALEK